MEPELELDTSSGDGAGNFTIPEPTFSFDVPPAPPLTPGEDGDSIDVGPSAIIPPAQRGGGRTRREEQPEEPRAEREPKTGPPDINEWMDFFSRLVLRVACDWYLSYAFSGVDEDVVSDRDVDRLKLTADERTRIARPFAELSYKSKFMRKNGRLIVASGGAFDAIVSIGSWMARVNRISRKYKTPKPKGRNNGNSRSGTAAGSGDQFQPFIPEGANGGRVPNGFPIVPGN